MEKAIIVQLLKQTENNSFLVNGWIELNFLYGMQPHSFNVIIETDIPYLVDLNNPIKDRFTGKKIPYVAPILGIESQIFQVPSEWEKGRNYHHSDNIK